VEEKCYFCKEIYFETQIIVNNDFNTEHIICLLCLELFGKVYNSDNVQECLINGDKEIFLNYEQSCKIHDKIEKFKNFFVMPVIPNLFL